MRAPGHAVGCLCQRLQSKLWLLPLPGSCALLFSDCHVAGLLVRFAYQPKTSFSLGFEMPSQRLSNSGVHECEFVFRSLAFGTCSPWRNSCIRDHPKRIRNLDLKLWVCVGLGRLGGCRLKMPHRSHATFAGIIRSCQSRSRSVAGVLRAASSLPASQ